MHLAVFLIILFLPTCDMQCHGEITKIYIYTLPLRLNRFGHIDNLYLV